MGQTEVPGDDRLNPIAALRPGLATACGSLPHTDIDDAIALVLDVLGECPSAPSLPSRHPCEGMLGQAAAGMEGVAVAVDGSLVVAEPDHFDATAEAIGDELPADAFATALAFLDAVAARLPASPPALVKLQCTGPVTFGTALVAAGVSPRRAYPAAAVATRRRARALLAAAR